MSGVLLGLFPTIEPNRFGGVELSGRLAWEGIRERAATRNETPILFSYSTDAHTAPAMGQDILVQSKTQALRRALGMRVKPRVILVWHLAMLRIVPWLRAPKARVIVFLHGIEAWHKQDALTQFFLPRVNLFLSNSQYTYERFVGRHEHLKAIPHEVVPLGVGTAEHTFLEPSLPPRLLMVSRLERGEDYKGHREMIGVWGRVRAEIPDAELWIAGEGDLRADLEALTRELNVASSVRFLGRVSEARKEELLHECSALAMPSRGEGFGLVYVEAMRVGRPCLVSDYDAGREVVNPPEAGLAAAPSDREQLARAAIRLLTRDTEWERWSQQARARYNSHFTAAQFQERLVARLEEGTTNALKSIA